MTTMNLFCISEEELAADRAVVDALPKAPTAARAARHLPYTGPFPRKRHYHRCETCFARGRSNGVNCYKKNCTRAVLHDGCWSCQ
jgi:hypothetical protein